MINVEQNGTEKQVNEEVSNEHRVEIEDYYSLTEEPKTEDDGEA